VTEASREAAESARNHAAAHAISRLLDDVGAYAQLLSRPRNAFLKPDLISKATGISPRRVIELLNGELPDEGPVTKDYREAFEAELFRERLTFLHETHKKLTPTAVGGQPTFREEKYSLRDIAEETQISYQMVSLLLNGKRGANAAFAARLEGFFTRAARARDPRSPDLTGFLLRTEGAALIAYLRQMVDVDLLKLTLKAMTAPADAVSMALRTTGDASEIDVRRDLLPALAKVMAAVRERQEQEAGPDTGRAQ
jgi:transcriptional regulator with XRE-family HTH domain